MEIIEYVPGKKISEPGIYRGIPLDVYHGDLCAGPSASSSVLRTIVNDSPADAFLTSPYNPERVEKKPTESLTLGRAAHHLLLGQPHFKKEYVQRPDKLLGEPWQGNRKVCKDWLADQAAKGITVVTAEQIKRIIGMAKSLGKEPLVQNGLLAGRTELSMIYQDKATGLWVKVRPDAMPTDVLDFADLKTTTDVHDDELEKVIGTYGYHMQAGLTALACPHVLGQELHEFLFAFVQSEAPFSPNIITAKPSDIHDGMEACTIAMAVFKKCLDAGEWPGPAGYSSSARYLGRTEWAVKQQKARLQILKQEFAIK